MSTSEAHTEPRERRRWNPPVAGALLGTAAGCFDALLFWGLDLRVSAFGHDATPAAAVAVIVTTTTVGYLIGSITAARRIEREQRDQIREQLATLRQTQAQLVAHERLAAVGQMAAGVAHEVRNPLGVIRSAAGVIVEDLPDGDERAEAGRFIREEVDRLDRFVRRLLDFSRPTQVQLRVEPVGDVLTRHKLDLERVAAAHGAHVHLEIGASASIAHDPDMTEAVLRALVENACVISEDDISIAVGAVVEARAGTARASQPRVSILVRDDGPGVDPDIEPRLFEPFFTTRPSGTGLGLAMAKRLAAAQGAELSYDAGAGLGPAGAGACFRLCLAPAPVTAEARA